MLARYPVALVLDGAVGARVPGHRAVVAAAERHHVKRISPDAGQVLRAGALRAAGPVAPPRARGAPRRRRSQPARDRRRAARRRLRPAAAGRRRVGRHRRALPAAGGRAKVAHHGSADPGLAALLRRLRPRFAAIEVGRHNSYGHPTAQALAALRAAVPQVYRTDRDGTVTLDVAGAAWRSPAGADRSAQTHVALARLRVRRVRLRAHDDRGGHVPVRVQRPPDRRQVAVRESGKASAVDAPAARRPRSSRSRTSRPATCTFRRPDAVSVHARAQRTQDDPVAVVARVLEPASRGAHREERAAPPPTPPTSAAGAGALAGGLRVRSRRLGEVEVLRAGRRGWARSRARRGAGRAGRRCAGRGAGRRGSRPR